MTGSSVVDRPITRVAVIGLGSIGSRMAARLGGAGFQTAVWNRSDRPTPALDGSEVRRERTPCDATTGAELIVLALSDDRAVREVMTHPEGVLAGCSEGTIVVDTSTCAPQTSRDMHARSEDHGVYFIDAPLTGGAERATNGTLTLLLGGDVRAVERARPVLERLASRIEHFGASGSGQVAKAVNQVILAGALLGVAEGVAMAEAAGLDAHHLVDVLKDGAGSSWVLSNRAGWMIDRSFPPAGRIALHLKDLKIAIDLARTEGQLLPGATLVMGMEEALTAGGFGDEDVSALIRMLRNEPDPAGERP